MSDQNNYKYRYFVYSFIISYIVINHMFSKTCIILDAFLDKKLALPTGTNVMTVGTSTAFSALGKFIGIFIEGSKKKIIVFGFFGNAICMLLCITSSYFPVYVIARTLQGLCSGLQMSVLFGLIGTLKDCKTGFANFTTISSIVCFSTGVLLFFLDPLHLFWGLVLGNIAAGLFFWKITTFKDKSFSMKEIDWPILTKLVKNRDFLIKTSFLGFFLGCAFLAIGKQKSVIMNVFNIKFEGLSNALSTITFLASGITSFFNGFHSLYLFNIMNFLCVCCIFLGLVTKSIYIFLTGIFLPFCCFSIINPVIMEEVTLVSSHRFISSAFASCFRSVVTSIVICIMPLLTGHVLEVAIASLFLSGIFFTLFYGKNNF